MGVGILNRRLEAAGCGEQMMFLDVFGRIS